RTGKKMSIINPPSRRRLLITAAAGLTALAGAPPGGIGPLGPLGPLGPGGEGGNFLAPDLDEIERGLAYLFSSPQQNKDGSFDSAAPPVASAALAVIAALAAGETPELGRNGRGITSAIKYLISQADSAGYIAGERASI